MGKIIATENVSLDGVIELSTGDEGFSRDDWLAALAPADRDEWGKLILDDALGAQALLLGRRSYEFFAARYPSRTGELADRMNSLPKYVVSTTLEGPGWTNSTVLDGGLVEAVSALKHTVDGEIRVYASSQLVRTLMEHDLVDEVRLVVFPFLLGSGRRLFDQTGDHKSLRLTDIRTVGSGLAFLVYQRIRDVDESAKRVATAGTGSR
ncbi:deaminase [Amycolatopsis balhimycina DSM 5908]|uniref:Deaminase n=1 Tax=Amycolatopsis balhimycina DSM 5908 TaxID=1081091 RepID=A0A428W5L3_AMYBA|nr:dihydrofolate reductase family protein [Amycolatopsis balhimycina]RSM38392.1 deaminase [Amycolatopsis balhimycina DSM 5908]